MLLFCSLSSFFWAMHRQCKGNRLWRTHCGWPRSYQINMTNIWFSKFCHSTNVTHLKTKSMRTISKQPATYLWRSILRRPTDQYFGRDFLRTRTSLRAHRRFSRARRHLISKTVRDFTENIPKKKGCKLNQMKWWLLLLFSLNMVVSLSCEWCMRNVKRRNFISFFS